MNAQPDYTVTQIRGPFLDLEPHPDHCRDLNEFKSYCKGLKKQGFTLAADLFSGAGGISLGLEEAGFKVVLGVDHYLEAVKTHRHHFGGLSADWDLSTEESIVRISELMDECEIEILAGGPPCQPFSKAGRNGIRKLVEKGQREPHDQRRDLWRSYLEIVSRAKPAAIIMENVPDMALDEEMFILRSMIEELEQLGYSVYEKVIEMWKYGVPQTRQRLILVAFRDGYEFTWPAEFQEKVTLWNAIGEMPQVEGGWRPQGGAQGWTEYDHPKTGFQKYIRRRVSKADQHKLYDHITRPVREDDREAFELMDDSTKYSDLPDHLRRYRTDIYNDKYNKLSEDDLSRTITAHISKDGYSYIHPRQPRTITVREAARIQTFPDDFRFNGPPSAAFKQIGNAVPPRAAAAISVAVKQSLDRKKPKVQGARDISSSIAKWFRDKPANAQLNPWLWTDSRWKAALGVMLLSRSRKPIIDQIWPVIDSMEEPTQDQPSVPEDTVEVLADMLTGIGEVKKVDRLMDFASQLRDSPAALWESKIDRSKLPVLRASEASMVELIAPISLGQGAKSEEPVLATTGVVRLTSRFQSLPSERRNRQTDGRLSVARMLGLNENSRAAHLGLVELTISHCRIERPHCHDCPIASMCDRFGVPENEVALPFA